MYILTLRQTQSLGIAVDSSTSMTAEPSKAGKSQIEEANKGPRKRRRYIEILGSVAAGVVSLDKAGRIDTINSPAAKLLEIDLPVLSE